MAMNRTSGTTYSSRTIPTASAHSGAPVEVGQQSPSQPSYLPTTSQAIKLIPIQTVQEILGVKRSFINERVANKEMPLPVKLGTSRRAAVRWFEHEILEFVMKLAAERDQ